MAELTQNSEFNPFSVRAPIPDVEYFPSGDFMYFTSTKLASRQLFGALQDDSIYVIGLYGMGGCGKTTLVKEVGKEAKVSNLFERVVITTVSQTVNVIEIQDEIADLLGFTFEKKSKSGRARELWKRLQSGERILVILDDVWSNLNLEDIGIPLDNHRKGCKVLLTTRRLRVCNDMNCQRKIPLDLLSEDEAWILFHKKAAIVDDPSTSLLNGVQRDVARECKGLPIAIVAVATSLKGEPLDVWKVALHDLRAPKPIDVDEGLRYAYSCLRLSYDYLKSEQAKFLFLMCSMFPEDHDISIEELFRYGMGLDVYREVDSFEMARSKVNVAIKDLIDSSLLIYSENHNGEKCLNMHDMFRDMALCIASEESGTIMVDPTKDLNVLSDDGSMKDCYALSFWCNHIHPFPQQLDAPKLGFILINSRYKLDLSYASFEGIKELKVMAVIGNIYFQDLLVLPQTIQYFNNLRTLRLVGRDIRDISFVVSLKRLKILDLKRSKFRALPIGIENLNELKLLDLSSCVIEEDCYEVVGRCSQLEELYLLGAIRLPYEFFLNDVPLLKFQRYQLEIGESYLYELEVDKSMKVLFLNRMDFSNLGASIKVLLERANFVKLNEAMEGLKSIIPEMVQTVGGMKELTTLSLHSSSIEYIIDTTTSNYDNSSQADADFPILVHLELHKVDNLKEVCHGPPLLCILKKLESLDIRECNQLHNIFSGSWKLYNLKSLTISNCAELTALFPVSVAQSLLLLEHLEVDSCWKLKHITMKERQNGIDAINEEIFLNLKLFSIRNCCELEHIFSEECNLCNLKSLTISNCGKLTALFSMSVARSLPLLEYLEVDSCLKLKHMIMEGRTNGTDAVEEEIFPNLKIFSIKNCCELEYIFPHECNLCNLKSLTISGCAKLTTIFTMFVAQSLLLLQYFEVESCGRLKHIIEERQNGSDAVEEEIFPNLEIFSIRNCCRLEYIFPGECDLCNLKSLTISGCAKLMALFPIPAARSLLQLEDLEVDSCSELKHIIIEEIQNETDATVDQKIFPKLKNIYVKNCGKLEYVFSRECNLHNLKTLNVDRCVLSTSLFSISVAQTLLQLEDVTIANCDELQLLFGGQNIGYGSSYQLEIEIVLPALKSFTLTNLSKLVNICPENFHCRWPSLIELSCTDCSKLTALCKYSMVGNNSELRSLHSNMGSDVAIAENVSQSSSEVSAHCEKIEVLKLKNLFELSFIWMDSPQILSLPYLKELEVKGCRRLQSIFSTAISKSLLELTKLVISDCGELEEIMAENEETRNLSNTQLCFPKLMSLEVMQCNKLKCLFSMSTSIMLPKLEYLEISEAAQIEHAFGCRNEAGTNSVVNIMLPKLSTTELKQLPNFVDISQGLKLHLMELHSIVVHECPKFAPNLAQNVSLHTCRTEAVTSTDGKVCNEASYLQLASTTEEEQNNIITSNVQRLELKDFPDLMFIWKGPTLISFQNLVSLKVFGCSKLKSIFSDAIISSLPRLQGLYIEDCDELEEIVSSSAQGGKCHCDFSPKSCPKQVCFPKMAHVRVRNCNKIKFLFPIYIAEHLQRLESLDITEASQLEYVFSCGKKNHDHNGDDQVATMLPSLTDLLISRVPKFNCVVCGGFQSQLYFPSLEEKYRHHLLPSHKAHNPGDEYDSHSMKMDLDFMGDRYDGHLMKMDSHFMGDGCDGHSKRTVSDFMDHGYDGHSKKMNSDFMGDGYDDYSMMMDSDFKGDGYISDSDFNKILKLLGDDFDDDSLE